MIEKKLNLWGPACQVRWVVRQLAPNYLLGGKILSKSIIEVFRLNVKFSLNNYIRKTLPLTLELAGAFIPH